MKAVQFIFPHQLFKEIAWLNKEIPVYLIEESLFFKQYKFHKQKLVFHRASMKFYETFLIDSGYKVHYIECASSLSDIRKLIPDLIANGLEVLHVMNPTDNWLEHRIAAFKNEILIREYDNLLFINSKAALEGFFKSSKKKYFQTSFYKQQRLERNILMSEGKPEGGKWSFDDENRKKYPRDKKIPVIKFPEQDEYFIEAKAYVTKHFYANIGEIDQKYYPNTFDEAADWLFD